MGDLFIIALEIFYDTVLDIFDFLNLSDLSLVVLQRVCI
jgi:hypothetical protein